MKTIRNYFSKTEFILWSVSVLFITISFCIFDRESYLTLAASLIGVTSLIFNAKGNPVGQALMIVFSMLYGIISFTFAYYGEMITYLGMTMPMALFALISWLKNPYKGNKAEVKVNSISKMEHLLMWMLTFIVTIAFYSKVFQHSKHNPKHNIRNNKFSCRLFNISQMSNLCIGICRQRYNSNRVVGNGKCL